MKPAKFAVIALLVIGAATPASAETVSMKGCLSDGNALISNSSCPPANVACHRKNEDGTLGEFIGCADRVGEFNFHEGGRVGLERLQVQELSLEE